MEHTIPFTAMTRLLSNVRADPKTDRHEFTFLDLKHLISQHQSDWRPRAQAHSLLLLAKHLPSTFRHLDRNASVSHCLAELEQCEEKSLLAYVGCRMIGSKLLQISLLKSWTEKLSVNEKQTLAIALRMQRCKPRPPLHLIKQEHLARPPCQQAYYTLQALLRLSSQDADCERAVVQIGTFIEDYLDHAL